MSNLRQSQTKKIEAASPRQASRTPQPHLHPVEELQRMIGNRAMGQLKLQPHNPQQVNHSPELRLKPIQRHPLLFKGLSHELRGGQADLSMKQHLNQTGLPDPLKKGVENLSGYLMNDVRVHYSSAKPAKLQAAAYTQGTDIHVGPGQEKHLPHEAWHVVQQKQGRVKPTLQFKGVAINDNAALEQEADQMGRNALQYYSRNSGIQVNQDNSNISTQTNYSKVAQLEVTPDKIRQIGNRVSGWATALPDCLKVSKQLWNHLRSAPIEGQTEVKLAKYVWWRGQGHDKGGRLMTKDGKREIFTGQSHVAVKATIEGTTYIIDVTIGQFMKPKEAEVFVGTIEEWEQKLMELTDGRKDTIERNATIAEGFESFASPTTPLDEEHYVDEVTAYKLNQVPGQKKYNDKKKETGKAQARKSPLSRLKDKIKRKN